MEISILPQMGENAGGESAAARRAKSISGVLRYWKSRQAAAAGRGMDRGGETSGWGIGDAPKLCVAVGDVDDLAHVDGTENYDSNAILPVSPMMILMRTAELRAQARELSTAGLHHGWLQLRSSLGPRAARMPHAERLRRRRIAMARLRARRRGLDEDAAARRAALPRAPREPQSHADHLRAQRLAMARLRAERAGRDITTFPPRMIARRKV